MKLLTVIAALGLVLTGPTVDEAPTIVGDIMVYGANPELLDRAQWALGRFELARLDLPVLELRFHSSEDGCDGADGVSRLSADPLRIDVCNPHRFIILHELAHVWDHASLSDDQRDAFMELLGISAWSGHDVPYSERGIEQLAQIMVWGLNESGFADSAKLAAFELITGTEPVRSR